MSKPETNSAMLITTRVQHALALMYDESNASNKTTGVRDLKNILAEPDLVLPTEHLSDIQRVLTEVIYETTLSNDCVQHAVSALGNLVSLDVFPDEDEDFMIEVISNVHSSHPLFNVDITMEALTKILSKKNVTPDRLSSLVGMIIDFASADRETVRRSAVGRIVKLCELPRCEDKVPLLLDVLISKASEERETNIRAVTIFALGQVVDRVEINIIPVECLRQIIDFLMTEGDEREKAWSLSKIMESKQKFFPVEQILQAYDYISKILNLERFREDTATREELFRALYRIGCTEVFPLERQDALAQQLYDASMTEKHLENRSAALEGLAKLTRIRETLPQHLVLPLWTLALGRATSKVEDTSASAIHILVQMGSLELLPSERVNVVVRVLRMHEEHKTENRRIWVLSGLSGLCYRSEIRHAETQDTVLQVFLKRLMTGTAKEKFYCMRGIGFILENQIEIVQRFPTCIPSLVSIFIETLELEIDVDVDAAADDADVEAKKTISVWSMGELIQRNMVPSENLTPRLLRLFAAHIDAKSANVGISSLWAIHQWGASDHFPAGSVCELCEKLLSLLDVPSLKFRSIDALSAILVNNKLLSKEASLAEKIKSAVRAKYEDREEYFKGDGKPLGPERQCEVTKSMEAIISTL